MTILIHPTYFSNIANFAAIAQADKLIFEQEDNFLKQTYRSRTFIHGANGKLLLNIPVVHTQKNRQKYKDVKIAHDINWQDQHWKSILSAYSTSPFFEFYKDDIIPLFKTRANYIFDFNLKCFKTICDCLQLEIEYSKTDQYEKMVEGISDFRYLVNAKTEEPKFETYSQVFDDKNGFLNNLSILDLLFNEGPNALSYLENQVITAHQ